MNNVNDIFAERVKNGATFLDSEIPGWYNKINLNTINTLCIYDCVLGQLFNRFDAGIHFLDFDYENNKAEMYGFDCPDHDSVDIMLNYYKLLDDIWKREIKKRRLLDEIKLIQEKECVNA